MSEQEQEIFYKCPKCGQIKGKLSYTQSAMKVSHGLHGDYGNMGVMSFYECKNCGYSWNSFSGGSGPLWTLPIED